MWGPGFLRGGCGTHRSRVKEVNNKLASNYVRDDQSLAVAGAANTRICFVLGPGVSRNALPETDFDRKNFSTPIRAFYSSIRLENFNFQSFVQLNI